MAGYYNYKMSYNAIAAYEDGEKPRSKWAKGDIINALQGEGIEPEKIKLLQAARVEDLRRVCLVCSSWHHTSSYYNKTDFYSINIDMIQETSPDELKQLLKPEEKKVITEYRARCCFLVWSGTRKHPKATQEESTGTIRGAWFYSDTGYKKNINSNGFKILEKI